jgi:hypothetical protein
MLGRPNASPAWIVEWKFSRITYWKASRWRDGGYPASAPAMSNPTTPGVAPAHSELGDLEAVCRGAHRRHDGVQREVGALRATPEAVLHRLHHLVEGEAGLGVELGGESHLGVDDTVGGEILGALVRDAFERISMLHHPDGVGERLEVEHQVVALGARG